MNTLNWFEIAVTDMDRAVKFYQDLLGIVLRRELFAGTPNAIFPKEEKGTGGSLVLDAKRTPGNSGTVVYLDATGQLDEVVKRASSLGGTVLLPTTAIGDPGFIALIRDSEGNTVGLHAPHTRPPAKAPAVTANR
ncbi:MAG: VOC family protein [Polyangiales bacterium]